MSKEGLISMKRCILNSFVKYGALIFVSFLFFLLFVTGCSPVQRSDFSDLKKERESIDDLISNGTLDVQDNGLITLPESLKHLSHSGECFLAEFEGHSAIFFFEYRGMLSGSRGVLFVTDLISYEDYIDTDRYSPTQDFSEISKLESNWYSYQTKG